MSSRNQIPLAEVPLLPCVICGKTIGLDWTGDGKDYAHTECARSSTTRRKQACLNCGHMRPVKVTYYPLSKKELFQRWCTACELEVSAVTHMEQAKKLAAKARKIRERRKKNV